MFSLPSTSLRFLRKFFAVFPPFWKRLDERKLEKFLSSFIVQSNIIMIRMLAEGLKWLVEGKFAGYLVLLKRQEGGGKLCQLEGCCY
jgi:hypothetical protein